MTEPPVAPDDTPTREQPLDRVQSCWDEMWSVVVEEVERLQAENALLRRSLAMLTTQDQSIRQALRLALHGVLTVTLTDELKTYPFAFTREDIEQIRDWLQVYTAPSEV